MSSTLSIINWTPSPITVMLNQAQLDQIPTSTRDDSYYPYNLEVPRHGGPPTEGTWGADNNSLVVMSSASPTKIYNSLADPGKAGPNIALMLWVFPDCLIFSQLGEQLGTPVKPN
jgi:hypothetical protein